MAVKGSPTLPVLQLKSSQNLKNGHSYLCLLLGPRRDMLLMKGGGWQSQGPQWGDLAYPEVTCRKRLGPDETPALHTERPFLQDAVTTSVPAFPFPLKSDDYKNKSLEVT